MPFAGWINYDNSPLVILYRLRLLRLFAALSILPHKGYASMSFRGVRYRNIVKRGLPHADNSIHYVYSRMFFEHLLRTEALAVARESLRVLIPYGGAQGCGSRSSGDGMAVHQG